MPSGQQEVSFFMLGQSERGGLVTFEIMAAIAGVEVRRRGKLAGVTVAVAIGAAVELHLE